jgi:ATP-binding cassette subfamily B multidrug efflux pump
VLFGMMTRLLSGHKASVLAIVLLQLIQTVGNLLLPTVNTAIIDDGIVAGDTPVIVRLGAVMAAIAAAQAMAAIGAGYLSAAVAMKLGRQLRGEIFAKVQSLSSQEVAAFGTQSLVTRATNDTQQIQSFAVLVFTMLVAAPVMGVGGVVLALHQDATLSSVVIVIVPVLLLIMYLIVRRLVRLYRDGQELLDRTVGVLREQIIGANVIRAFVRQGHETRRFAETNASLTGNNLQSALVVAGMLPVIMIVVNLSSVAVVWFGGHRVHAGEMKLGALTAFVAYILQILLAIMMAMYVLMTAPRAAVCAERIRAVLDTVPSVRDGREHQGAGDDWDDGVRARGAGGTTGGAGTVSSESGAASGGAGVTFRNVSFSYPGAEARVLENISFTALPGATTAIVGSTGSGKSTLLNLVPRFLDSTAGRVTVDGRDVRSLPLDVLRGNMAVVPQRSHLFTGTIADNLRIAAPAATDAELWEALGTAQASDFVQELPLGLQTPVGQGGTNLSGGQRQRLCIARALLRRVSLYLFDDSFSALDYDTDARLREALEAVLSDAVVIFVAERIATVAGAGLILVLDDGRLVAQGTHYELLETCPTYREIAVSQLSLEETL